MQEKNPREHLLLDFKIEITTQKLRKENLKVRSLDLEEYSILKHENTSDSINNN